MWVCARMMFSCTQPVFFFGGGDLLLGEGDFLGEGVFFFGDGDFLEGDFGDGEGEGLATLCVSNVARVDALQRTQ